MVQVDLSEVRELPNGTRVFVECVGSEWYFEDKNNYETWNVKQDDGLHYEHEDENNTISFPYYYDYSGNNMDIICYVSEQRIPSIVKYMTGECIIQM